MNYLAHLHLGGDSPEQMLGSLYGDFVKGSLSGRFPAELEAAIHLHRRIDAFTDNHRSSGVPEHASPVRADGPLESSWTCSSTTAWRVTGTTTLRCR